MDDKQSFKLGLLLHLLHSVDRFLRKNPPNFLLVKYYTNRQLWNLYLQSNLTAKLLKLLKNIQNIYTVLYYPTDLNVLNIPSHSVSLQSVTDFHSVVFSFCDAHCNFADRKHNFLHNSLLYDICTLSLNPETASQSLNQSIN